MNTTESQLNYDNESTSEKEKSTELKDFSSNSNAIKVIIEILTELSSKMDESNMTLDRIVRKLLPEEDILAWPKDMPPLSLKTLNALDRMEDFLESSVNFSCMANYLAGRMAITTGDINLAIRSILVKIIPNNLARCISWKGTF
ncbi:unnamed protein product [Lasius platythorax]|uniref:Uncharacterized protein n=1 Tax=Lasius platythorax TaxID=488582 RepID=A0AAV2MW35_9HYME